MRSFLCYYFCDRRYEFSSSPKSNRSIMSGKRNAHAELLGEKWENKRLLDKSIREIERETQGLQAQEDELIAEGKKIAELGQLAPVMKICMVIERKRCQIEKLYDLKSQLEGVSIKIQALYSTQSMGKAMKGVTKAMEQMNLPCLQKILQEIERQNKKMELTSELVSAPSATVAAPDAKNKLPQAEAMPESNRSIMSFPSGKRKAHAELLQENKKKLDKAIREIEREIQGLQTQEKELLEERKKRYNKQGQLVAFLEISIDLNTTAVQINIFNKLKSQLRGVCLKILRITSTRAMGEAMKGATKAMGEMNKRMNLPSLQKIMQEFEKMELTSEEVMGDAIVDDASEGDEIVSAPSATVAAKNKAPLKQWQRRELRLWDQQLSQAIVDR